MRSGVGGETRDDEQVVYEWPKTDSEVIRATVKTWKGRRYYSLRLYFRSQDKGQFLPTKKGLTLGGDHLPDLLKAVKALSEAGKSEHAGAES